MTAEKMIPSNEVGKVHYPELEALFEVYSHPAQRQVLELYRMCYEMDLEIRYLLLKKSQRQARNSSYFWNWKDQNRVPFLKERWFTELQNRLNFLVFTLRKFELEQRHSYAQDTLLEEPDLSHSLTAESVWSNLMLILHSLIGNVQFWPVAWNLLCYQTKFGQQLIMELLFRKKMFGSNDALFSFSLNDFSYFAQQHTIDIQAVDQIKVELSGLMQILGIKEIDRVKIENYVLTNLNGRKKRLLSKKKVGKPSLPRKN